MGRVKKYSKQFSTRHKKLASQKSKVEATDEVMVDRNSLPISKRK